MTDTTHACPGGCGRRVPRHRYACPSDWFRLPLDLRALISATYRVDPGAHLQAMADAAQWYRENLREASRG